ncbi:MAG: hypothetical protein NDF56_02515 [archaeon GB-1845-036]|nr:hypothetical protein [Candidatus Culexmicrobium thermophilum]RLE52597.1 MAG: hypothetical protein DRJ30_07690 [Candidatus Verstraetearchaeota archaeon]
MDEQVYQYSEDFGEMNKLLILLMSKMFRGTLTFEALKLIAENNEISFKLLSRRLRISYSQTDKILNDLLLKGIVSAIEQRDGRNKFLYKISDDFEDVCKLLLYSSNL